MIFVRLTPGQLLTNTECRDVRSQLYGIRRQLARLGSVLGDLSQLSGDELPKLCVPLCDRVHAMEHELDLAAQSFRALQEKESQER